MNRPRSNSNAFYDKFARTPETINGVTKTRGEWCDERGVAYATAYYKMRDGLSFDEAARSSRATSWRRTLVTIDGETLEMCEHCPHADCVSSIRKCLAIKRAKEEEND